MTHATTTAETTGEQKRPVFAHMLRILAVPIILFWVAVAVIVNVVAPQLEVVGELHSAPMAPEDAPSMRAMKLMGANFKEFNSNSTIMVVIEGQRPSGLTRTTITTRSSASCNRILSTSSTSRTSGAIR
jgi:Predicted drug exporters of the RND superfamily